MFCALRIQAILVKSPIRPSSTTFPVVDIVNKAIQKIKGGTGPFQASRHPALLPAPLSSNFTNTYRHLLGDNHLKAATEMNASFQEHKQIVCFSIPGPLLV